MKVFRVAIAVCVLCLFGAVSFAATTSGTVTVYESEGPYGGSVMWDWLSDASGNVVDDSAAFAGRITRVTFNPDATTTSPTANYDMDVVDIDSVDVLLGAGANLSQSASECIFYNANSGAFASSTVTQTVDTDHTALPWSVVNRGKLTLTITNAGNAKGGTVRMYYTKEE